MLTEQDIKGFKKHGFTDEQIKDINESLEDFKQNGVSYSIEESKKHVEEEVFSKYMKNV